MTTAEAFTAPVAFHGEGAFWDEAVGALRMVDMLEGDVLTVTAEGSVSRTRVGTVAAVVRARAGGGYLVATEHGFAVTDVDLRVETQVSALDDAALRFNEGGCDPQGRFYCGTMAYDLTPSAGTLYRLDPDLSVHVVLDEVTIPNGLQWSADGSTVTHADTAAGRIWQYDFDPARGAFSGKREFIAFDESMGAPDGTARDEDGGLWVAMWGGGAVRRFDAQGRLVEVIDLPVSNPTSCAFGGPDRDILYITTSQQEVDVAREPLAGAVFVASAGTRGAAPHPFAG